MRPPRESRYARGVNAPSLLPTSVATHHHSASDHLPPEIVISSRLTWRPPSVDVDHNHDHRLQSSERDELPDSAYALPAQRKLPLTNAGHVRAALARFDQVSGVSDADRELAWTNLQAAARHFDVEVRESRWQDLGRAPHTHNPAHDH